MIHRQQIKLLVSASCELVSFIGAANFSADTGQAVLSAYNKAKSRLSSSEVASRLNLSDAELPLFGEFLSHAVLLLGESERHAKGVLALCP